MSELEQRLRGWSQGLADSITPVELSRVMSATSRPTASRERGWKLLLVAAVALVALGVVGIATLGRDTSEIQEANDAEPNFTASTAADPLPTTVTTMTQATEPAPIASTAGTAATEVPSTTLNFSREDCGLPLPPPRLVSGNPAGTGVRTANDMVVWGSGTASVTEIVGAEIGPMNFELAEGAGNLREANGSRMAVTPVGDEDTGIIQLAFVDAVYGCERLYTVGPGVLLDEALSLAQDFVSGLE